MSRYHIINSSRDFEGGVSPPPPPHPPPRILPLCQVWWPEVLRKCRYKILNSKGHLTCWMLKSNQGRCNISNCNPNTNSKFNVCKLPIFSLNHVHLSPTAFVNPYKIKTRFQFSTLYFVDLLFSDYLVE